MSVIIRLQNLPWSANALDIRQFFKGLSIPEGGVHIVGGEMGDAFIAFSTDEDARQAMMYDRKAINGVQIRLLLSSRAEMQKVIETARQQSLLALKNASVLPTAKATPPVVPKPKPEVNSTPLPPVISANSFQSILSNPLAATPSFLAYQQQAGITLTADLSTTSASSKSYNKNDSDDSETRYSRDRRRSESRERKRSRSGERSVYRRRRERSRERSRDQDRQSGRRSTRRSRSRERSRNRTRDPSRDRSRDRSRERSRNSRDNSRRTSRDNNIKPRNVDVGTKSKQNTSSWNITNTYQANYNSVNSSTNAGNIQQLNKLSGYQANFNSLDLAHKSNIKTNQFNKQPVQPCGKNNFASTVGSVADALPSSLAATVSVSAVSTTFQNYNTNKSSLTALNNYSLSSLLTASASTDSFKGFALQNPYTTALQIKSQESTGNTTTTSTIPGIFVEKKSDALASIQPSHTESVLVNNLQQEPIAFSTVNPYEQMYPNLFAQAAATSGGNQKSTLPTGKKPLLSLPSSTPTEDEFISRVVDPNDTNTVKISNMCSRTTYSDLRKFFVGLFIPHNGIKMINDKHGLRVGKAYVQFTRQSSVAKALCRCNNLLKGMSVTIEPVAEEEFDKAEDSFRPINQRSNDSEQDNTESTENNNSSGFSPLNPYKKVISTDPFTVLYIEDIPALVTEQDIIKMFSSYSLYDILLLSSPENRREFVAHVRFSREDDAKSAYEDRAHHQIGYRRLRVRPGTIEDMENAKEKIRLANEQLMKEEQEAQVAAEEEETKRKLEKLISEQITREEEKQHQEQNIVSMDLTEDGDEDENDDVIETTNEMKSDNEIYDDDDDADDYGDDDNTEQLASNKNYSLSGKNSSNNFNNDNRRSGPNIPSIFDLDPMYSNSRTEGRSPALNDPRLRNGANNNILPMGANNFNNFNSNFNSQQTNPPIVNSIEDNFVILKNCDYNTRINDVAQLFLTANLGLKHIEPLRNERQLPSGEFIVEFRRTQDAETAIHKFHNIQFRNRSLRVFAILPQEIADRLGKPFLSYIPGGHGPRINDIGKRGGGTDNMGRNSFNKSNNLMNNSRFGINTSQQRSNFNSFRVGNDNAPINSNTMRGVGGVTISSNLNISNDMSDNMSNNNDDMNNYTNGMPEKFNRPGCVLTLENVPYKASLSDILCFFQDFELTDNDIIRRFNDDGSPTGDARVAFVSPDVARDAFETKKRKQIFGRTIFLNII